MKIFDPAGVNLIDRMNASEPSRLITECIAGNQATIERLVRQYETGVFKLALSILGDEADAYEVMQETFIAALKSLRTYQEKKTFKAWLYTIALNLSRGHLRKRKIVERLKAAIVSVLRLETQKQPTPEDDIVRTEKESAKASKIPR